MRNVAQLCWLQILHCSCANESTLFSFLRSLLRENGSFAKIFIKTQAPWLNDNTIIELGSRKISWFVSVSEINYLPKPKAEGNNWSAITIFCSTSSNNCQITCNSSYFTLSLLLEQNRPVFNSFMLYIIWGNCALRTVKALYFDHRIIYTVTVTVKHMNIGNWRKKRK